jgi:hypothetical protein
MKVFAVSHGIDYEGSEIKYVADSRKKAEAWQKLHLPKRWVGSDEVHGGDYVFIEEWEVN